MQENPSAVKVGMEAITDSVLTFVRECVRVGVDGFYASTQGRESHRFADTTVFDECVRPYDLAVMEEIDRTCEFNILHICDYNDSYDDLKPFVDYPGHIVNCNLQLEGGAVSAQTVEHLFQRPFMGGMDRKGALATGTVDQVRAEALKVLESAPQRFFLAADCTIPAPHDWNNLKAAIQTAHEFKR
jgi:uroporphyrinogen decarboxylase